MRQKIKQLTMNVMIMSILFLGLMPAAEVYAATGKTTLAVTASELEVGEKVTITVRAKTDSGADAKAKMNITYNDDILVFVSCSESYDGGTDGSVTVTAKSFKLELKAVAEGTCPVYVKASNGVVASSGASLSSVEGCSTNITVTEGGSVAVEEPTEQEPAENGEAEASEELLAEVAALTTTVETLTSEKEGLKATLEDEKALRESLTNSYQALEGKYEKEKDFSRMVIYVLIFVIAILFVLLVNVALYCHRKLNGEVEDIFAEKKAEKIVEKKSEKKPEKRQERKPEEKRTAPAEKENVPLKKVVQAEKKPEVKAPVKKETVKKVEVFDFND